MLNRLRVGSIGRLTVPFLGGFLVFLLAANAHATPLADYHKNLQHVINALDSLSQSDEDESASSYETRFVETIASVRLVLPRTQLVQTSTGNITAENSWLHTELDLLQKAPAAKRRQALFHLLQQLRALEQRVAELEAPAAETVDKAAAKDRLNGILSRPEFAPKGKVASAFSRFIEWIARWLEKALPKQENTQPGRGFSIVRIAQYIVVALCVIVLAYVLRVFLPVLRRRKKRVENAKPEARVVLGEHVAADESSKDLLSDAEALARAGQLRAAIRKAYIALLVELGDRKLISLAQHKTNRDYLRSVRETPELHASMMGLTDIFERNWYGLAQPTTADWQAFREGYHQTLRTHN